MAFLLFYYFRKSVNTGSLLFKLFNHHFLFFSIKSLMLCWLRLIICFNLFFYYYHLDIFLVPNITKKIKIWLYCITSIENEWNKIILVKYMKFLLKKQINVSTLFSICLPLGFVKNYCWSLLSWYYIVRSKTLFFFHLSPRVREKERKRVVALQRMREKKWKIPMMKLAVLGVNKFYFLGGCI